MNVKILGRLCGSGKVIPLYTFKIPAGFPNPAADHIEQDFSFDRLMDLRAPHIYVAKIEGDSMEGAKIFHDSLVVVDCSGLMKPDTHLGENIARTRCQMTKQRRTFSP
ncbi:LexA family protein, partial [Pseudomonas syringae group genomosp. 3]|uniref:LexA family protein n=2 Tax=Pseudomonas syringae group genomosp. 3 TaxID=251701 RepID=UPI001F228B13